MLIYCYHKVVVAEEIHLCVKQKWQFVCCCVYCWLYLKCYFQCPDRFKTKTWKSECTKSVFDILRSHRCIANKAIILSNSNLICIRFVYQTNQLQMFQKVVLFFVITFYIARVNCQVYEEYVNQCLCIIIRTWTLFTHIYHDQYLW